MSRLQSEKKNAGSSAPPSLRSGLGRNDKFKGKRKDVGRADRQVNFDPLARPYRWLEYLTFSRALERCRFHYLPALADARRALVFGDGDGRFLARLLEANSQLQADVIDISPAMLRHLNERLTPEAQARVALHQVDAREFHPSGKKYDLVVTHFFLDCLFASDIAALLERVTPQLAPGALWVVSEFALPQGRAGSLAGKAIVSTLYRAFGVITGLSVRTLPDYAAALRAAGFQILEEKPWLGGLLVSQLWHQVWQ